MPLAIQSDVVDKALNEAMAQLQLEWDSTVCPVCSKIKWAHYPFCRSCSITLQRMKLMAPLKQYASYGSEVIKRHSDTTFYFWFRNYDRARDYLWVTHHVNDQLEDGRIAL